MSKHDAEKLANRLECLAELMRIENRPMAADTCDKAASLLWGAAKTEESPRDED